MTEETGRLRYLKASKRVVGRGGGRGTKEKVDLSWRIFEVTPGLPMAALALYLAKAFSRRQSCVLPYPRRPLALVRSSFSVYEHVVVRRRVVAACGGVESCACAIGTAATGPVAQVKPRVRDEMGKDTSAEGALWGFEGDLRGELAEEEVRGSRLI